MCLPLEEQNLVIKQTNYSRDFVILKQNKINKEMTYDYIFTIYIYINIMIQSQTQSI